MSLRSFDDIKVSVSIEEVLLEAGAEIQLSAWGQEQPVFCPFHLNVRTPAGTMNTVKNLYFCHGCDVGGSVIDVAMAHLQTDSVREAADWLEETFLD